MTAPKRLAAVVCYGAAVALAIALFAIGLSRSWALERELFWLRASGWLAVSTLLLALSATPIGRSISLVSRRPLGPWIAALRRALGVSAAALATLHGGVALRTYLGGSLAHLWDLPWVRGGILAWAILLALWITSYPRLVERLRVRSWKPLHRLAYVAAIFALQHTLLAPLAPRGWVIGVFGVALVIGLGRLLPQRRSSASQSSSQAQI